MRGTPVGPANMGTLANVIWDDVGSRSLVARIYERTLRFSLEGAGRETIRVDEECSGT